MIECPIMIGYPIMSGCPIMMEWNNLQNGHPTPCRDLHSTNNDNIIAGDGTTPHRPHGIASGDRRAMLQGHRGVSNAYDATLKTETEPHRQKSINYACDQFREPFQRDLVAVPRLIPYLNLPFP